MDESTAVETTDKGDFALELSIHSFGSELLFSITTVMKIFPVLLSQQNYHLHGQDSGMTNTKVWWQEQGILWGLTGQFPWPRMPGPCAAERQEMGMP